MKLTEQEWRKTKKELEEKHRGRLCLTRQKGGGDWIEGVVKSATLTQYTVFLCIASVDGRRKLRTPDSEDLKLLDQKVELKRREKKEKPKVRKVLRKDINITEDNLLDYVEQAESYIGREFVYYGEPKGRVFEVAVNRSTEKPAVYLKVRTPQNGVRTYDIRFEGIEIAPADEQTEALRKKHQESKGDEPKRLMAGRKLYRLIERKNLWQEKKEKTERELAKIKDALYSVNDEIEQVKKEMIGTM